MIRNFTLRELIVSLVPGFILVGGTWYCHRACIESLFPTVAASEQLKSLVILLASVSAGVTIHSLSDVPVVLIVGNDRSPPSNNRFGRFLKFVGRVFWFRTIADPRSEAFNAYLGSLREGRNPMFLRMVHDWAGMTEESLLSLRNTVIAHQHLVAHLRALSPESHLANDELLTPVHYSSSLFISVAALIPVLLCVPLTGSFDRLDHPTLLVIILAAATYFAAVLLAYVFKRRVRQYFKRILTLALHFYMVNGGDGRKATVEKR